MKKVIIAGAFDCMTLKEVNLIKEGLKCAVGGELWIILYGGYQHFKDYGFFPTQSIKQRVTNLSHFISPDRLLYRDDYLKGLKSTLFVGSENDKFTFVHYGDDKNFPGREDLKKENITIKFIKPYVKA